jgi:hypothetical protein
VNAQKRIVSIKSLKREHLLKKIAILSFGAANYAEHAADLDFNSFL